MNTTMLVFERNNKDVLFVDASSLISRERRNDAVITAENKEKLSNILEGKKEVDAIKWEYVGARLKTKYEEIIKKH